jgi:hypothetical protein
MKQRDSVNRAPRLTSFFSVSYDPITLEYNQDAEGETLRYMDDIVKWKVRHTHAPPTSFHLNVCCRPSYDLLRWRSDLPATASILSLVSL